MAIKAELVQQIISLGSSLLGLSPNIGNLVQWEHENSDGIGVGSFCFQLITCNISEMGQDRTKVTDSEFGSYSVLSVTNWLLVDTK